MIIVLMGVCGSGKTTVGNLLSLKLSFPFNDADDYHPPSNKAKMSSGIALTDEDRLPWLEILNDRIKWWSSNNMNAILACSALKKSYRQHLSSGLHDKIQTDSTSDVADSVIFVYLKGSFECISRRISQRKNHFMPPDLLQSQFKDLEEPTDSDEKFIAVDVCVSIEDVVEDIIKRLDLQV